MLLIDRYLIPPPAWPPPRDEATIAASVDYARARDPIGHAVHTLLGCLYLGVAGLSTASESIAFVLLVGYAALRAPNLWRAWMPLIAAPVLWAMVAFFAWAALSLAWSPDIAAGRGVLGGSRAILLVFALYPIRSSWRMLLGSLLASMCLQSCIQLAQAIGLLAPHPRNGIRHAGLYSHPGHLCTYHAAALLIAVAWLREATSRTARTLLLATCVCTGTGLAIAFGRGAIVALAISLPLLCVALWRFFGVSARTMRVAFVALAIIATGVAGVAIATGAGGITRGATDVKDIADVGSSGGSRVLWWGATFDTFRAHPLIGIGSGGTRAGFLVNPTIRAAADRRPDLGIEFFAHEHPHSMYLQTMSELGLVGVALLLLIVALAARDAWTSAKLRPILCGVAAALLMWSIAAGFDALHTAGRTATLATALLSFVILPRRAAWDGA